MKNLSSTATLLFFTLTVFAQAPETLPYQGVARDSTSSPIPAQHMNARMSIYNGSPTGTLLYQEQDTFTTTPLGLFTINIGSSTTGVTGSFSTINWADSAKFLRVELDPTGGTSFLSMGTSQLLSVPYALYAGQSGSSASATGTATQVPYFNRSGVLHSDSLFTRNDSTYITNIFRTATGGITEGFTLGTVGDTAPNGAILGLADTTTHRRDFMGAGDFSGVGYSSGLYLASRSTLTNGPRGVIGVEELGSQTQISLGVFNPGQTPYYAISSILPTKVAAAVQDTNHLEGLLVDTVQAGLYKAFTQSSPRAGIIEGVYAGGPTLLGADGAGAARIEAVDSALHFDFVGEGNFSNLNSPLLSSGAGMVHLRLSSYDSASGINPTLIASLAAVLIEDNDTVAPSISMICGSSAGNSLAYERLDSSMVQIIKSQNHIAEGLAIGRNQYANMGDGAFLVRYDSATSHEDVIGEFYTSLFSNPDTSHVIGLLCEDIVANSSAAFLLADSDPVNPAAMIITQNASGWGSLAQFNSITAAIAVQNGSIVNGLYTDTNTVHLLSNGYHWNWPTAPGADGQALVTDALGNLSWNGNNLATDSVFTPSSGNTINAVWGSNIVNPSSGLSSLTIALPASPVAHQTVFFTFTQTITSLSFTGGTVTAPLAGISSVANGSVKYWLTYDARTSAWY